MGLQWNQLYRSCKGGASLATQIRILGSSVSPSIAVVVRYACDYDKRAWMRYIDVIDVRYHLLYEEE
ncbi:hypothetical protein H4Q26_005228 [Puccinia striiformis f. sp. tritici PST-130]|nr:hypothetical protein H4Q26_005228 [Puccinia striiformis f. sp. tritici PST-130]